jgi:hypothetical protein
MYELGKWGSSRINMKVHNFKQCFIFLKVNQCWQVKKFGLRDMQFSILLWTCMLTADFYEWEGHEH